VCLLLSLQIKKAMTEVGNDLITKTAELEQELKRTGLWQKDTPGWVHWYSEDSSIPQNNFAQWLQFVFIPNHLNKNKTIPAAERNLIVLHAIKYFGDDVKKGKLLQLLIEIDALL
jgi:uncharacterized protein YqcC (DUF446 family)